MVSVTGRRWSWSLRSRSLVGKEPTHATLHAHQPWANSPTGVSSLISRYVSKKWLMKKGSRFTWPGSQRTRESVKYPHASSTRSPRRHRAVGAAEDTESVSSATAAFLEANGTMPVDRLIAVRLCDQQGHQPHGAIEPWPTLRCVEV